MDARVVVMDARPGPPVLGVKGFLECIRFAVDPSVTPHDDSLLFFGVAGGGRS